MSLERADLERLVTVARELNRRKNENPLERVKWLPGQHAFLSSTAKRKMFRAGQQAQGKTWAGAAELIFRMSGDHPFRDDLRGAPIRAWVICGGGEQSQVVQSKVWDLVPRGLLAPGCAYDQRKGAFLGKYPKLIFRNGSVAEFKSGQSDAINLASGTIDYVWIDEPPESERVYSELLKRLLKRNGDMALTLTPVNRPVEWLRDECEAGRIQDLHFDLTPVNLIPVGETEPLVLTDGTVCDQAWIDKIIAETPPAEVPVVVRGGWEFSREGGYFSGAWDAAKGVTANGPTGDVEMLIGVDHGDRPGKQCIYLIAVDERHVSGHPYVYVVDEYVAMTGHETPEDDARATLAMVRRNGLEWHELKSALGDRVHAPGRGQQKSNRDLQAQIAKLLSTPRDLLRPQIRTAKRGEGRGAGSVGVRSRWLFHQMVRGCFAVHPRCTALIEALPKYTGADDEWKDKLDAVLYGCDSYTFNTWRRGTVTPIRVR